MLTKSILDWKKEGDMDRSKQISNEQMLFNPYDKYNLRKRQSSISTGGSSTNRLLMNSTRVSKLSSMLKDKDA